MVGFPGLTEYGDKEYLKLVGAFIDKSLNIKKWTHESHLIVAIWFIMQYEPFDALCRIKSSIINYNIASGGLNDGVNGYHETITVCWWKLITKFVKINRGLSYGDMCAKFLESGYSDRNTAYRFYSKERLLSQEARAIHMPPDIQEISLDI